MRINVELRDENGLVLERITENGEVRDILPEFSDPQFPLLGFVDPYGDTVFNSGQMRAVIPELQMLRPRHPGAESLFDRIDAFAQQCSEGVGLFLVFVGD